MTQWREVVTWRLDVVMTFYWALYMCWWCCDINISFKHWKYWKLSEMTLSMSMSIKMPMAIPGCSVWSFNLAIVTGSFADPNGGARAGLGRGDPAGHWKVGEDDKAKQGAGTGWGKLEVGTLTDQFPRFYKWWENFVSDISSLSWQGFPRYSTTITYHSPLNILIISDQLSSTTIDYH